MEAFVDHSEILQNLGLGTEAVYRIPQSKMAVLY